MQRLRGFRRFWATKPLVTRLTVLLTLLLGFGMIISGTVMVSLLQRHLIDQIDSQLKGAAQSILNAKHQTSLSSYGSSPTQYYILFDPLDSEHFHTVAYASTLEAAGEPIIPDLIPRSPTSATGILTQPVTISSHKNGFNWRAIAFAVDESDSGQATSIITIALPLNDMQQTMRTTTLYFMLLGGLIVIVGGFMGSYLVRQSLSSLRNIEIIAGKIAAGDLTQRVKSEPSTTEVGSLARSLNIMLSHVERAFATQQESELKTHRFVSDASHELRTPLAAIRGYGELYAMGGIPENRVAEVMGRIHDEATRMGSLVEDLLTLARLDEKRPLEIEDVDLVKLVENAAFDMRALDPSRVVTMLGLETKTVPESVIVPADSDRIQQVFTNLVGNIARYTPRGTPVEFSVGVHNGCGVVEFRDHGPGIRSQDRKRVFERFYRAEDSRNRSLGGSGLGLAIVAGIIQAHRGNATLSKTEGGGLTVTVSLPLNTPSEP